MTNPEHEWRERPPAGVRVYLDNPGGQTRHEIRTLPRWKQCARCGVSHRAATAFGWTTCQRTPTTEHHES